MATITISNILGIVFDLDGTLVNSVEAHVESWYTAFKTHGINRINKEDIRELIGLPGEKIVLTIGGEAALKKYKSIRKLKDETFIKLYREGKVKLFIDVEDTLTILKDRGYKLGLSTSTPSYILEEFLSTLNIKRFFDTIVPGDEVKKGKPDPEIYEKAFKKMGIDPKRGVVVGDSKYDIIPAKKIGSLAILVDYPRRQRPDTWSTKPDIIINKVSDLLKIL